MAYLYLVIYFFNEMLKSLNKSWNYLKNSLNFRYSQTNKITHMNKMCTPLCIQFTVERNRPFRCTRRRTFPPPVMHFIF